MSKIISNGQTLELKSEMARLCFPTVNRDPNCAPARAHSLCFPFLVIGIAGAKRRLSWATATFAS